MLTTHIFKYSIRLIQSKFMNRLLESNSYVLAHPGRAVRIKVHQLMVGMFFLSQPISVADRFDFVRMPLSEAWEAEVRAKKMKPHHGVLQGDWSTNDQKLMAKGKNPRGVPRHENI